MKESILGYLKGNKEGYLSGEYLSNIFGVTRAAIWKVIKHLEEEGYIIESKTKLGYKLVASPDCLNPYEIKAGLKTKRLAKKVHYFQEVNSTNNIGKELTRQSFDDGDIVVAECQTGGKGRFTRQWISPSKKGIYMSILLKPQISYENITQMTLFSALAVCEALEEHTQMELEIKWPNDILCNQKKICGILTEISGEVDKINYAIVGIGININLDEGDFGEELKDKATSLKIETGCVQNRVTIIQKILTVFDKYYDNYLSGATFEEILIKYKRKLTIINKIIEIRIHHNAPVKAMVLDIKDNGALKVQMEDGQIKEFLSGEISLKKE